MLLALVILVGGCLSLVRGEPEADWHVGPGYRFTLLPAPARGDEGSAATEVSPGFTEMPAARTGVTFMNALPVSLMMENNHLMNGSGVAAGDVDGDGWCDLYFCAINGTNALLRNRGGWRFEDVTARAGVGCEGLRSTGATFADFDGDGDLDLLVATLGHGVHSFVNDGAGRFRETTAEAGLASRTGSTTLALADVDGDGDLDLYVANYGELSILRAGGRAEIKRVDGQWVLTGPHAYRLRLVEGRLEEVGEPDVLYLNDGAGRFQPVPWDSEYFLDEAGQPRAAPWDFGLTAQFRDINDDGVPDLYVCNDFQTVDRLWLNDGRGRFRLVPRLALRKQSFSSMGVDFADVDSDGRLDFFVTEMQPREHARRLRSMVGAQPVWPVPGRLDNRPEVPRNTLFWNRGETTFSEVAEFAGVPATDWSWQPFFLDVDLDGDDDLLVFNGMAFDVQDRDVLAHVRSLGRQPPEMSRRNLALYPSYLSPNVAFRNRGGLRFEDCSAAWGFQSTNICHGAALADLDNDGDLDLVSNSMNAPALLLRNNVTVPRLAVRLKGRAPNTRGVGARLRVTTARGLPPQRREVLCGGRYLSGDDGLQMFAAGGPDASLTIEVLWRRGARSLIADARAGRLYEIEEPAAADTGPSAAEAWGSRDQGRPTPAVTRSTPDTRPSPPATAPDLQSTEATQPLFIDLSDQLHHTHHEEAFEDYARQPLLMKQLSQLGPGAAWFDWDADGRDEVAIGSGKGGQIAVYRRDGQSFVRLAAATTNVLADDATGLAAWCSAGGQRALLVGVANYESGAAGSQILLAKLDADGQVAFEPHAELSLPGASVGPIAVADVDGDGDLDVFLGGRVVPGAYPRPAPCRLYVQTPRGLTAPSESPIAPLQSQSSNLQFQETAPGLVSAALWCDLTGDGYPELVLACEWGPLRVFRNRTGRLEPWDPPLTWSPLAARREAQAKPDGAPRQGRTDTQSLASSPASSDAAGSEAPLTAALSPLSALTGWWTSLASGDFDGDGRMDLVAGNWGLNTGYRASVEQPLRLYSSGPNERGGLDLIETYVAPELGYEVPRRTLTALQQAFPSLARSFPSHRAFSVASAVEVIAATEADFQVVSANTLLSLVLLNRGDTFEALPLPWQAALSPVFALNVADFDGDGHEDLFLGQNFFGMRPEWPRADAGHGLVLLGRGDGTFRALAPGESGVWVYGEQRGAAVGDFNDDRRPDLLVTQNGNRTVLLQNAAGRPGLRVRLKGPPGNPAGIGARIRLQFNERRGAAREIHAGAGYWSQDSLTPILATPEPVVGMQVVWPGGASTFHRLEADAPEAIVEWTAGEPGTPP